MRNLSNNNLSLPHYFTNKTQNCVRYIGPKIRNEVVLKKSRNYPILNLKVALNNFFLQNINEFYHIFLLAACFDYFYSQCFFVFFNILKSVCILGCYFTRRPFVPFHLPVPANYSYLVLVICVPATSVDTGHLRRWEKHRI